MGVDAPPTSAAAGPAAGRGGFRAEIQALRALAVAGVVAYHLWPAVVPGGFVGVDVFFVISGFLITQQLAAELLATGRVSLVGFWARRIRRILPAAFTVLLGCVAVVVVAAPRVEWANNLADIRAAAAYAENWQLGAHAVNYLAAENSPSLVQHYWSLSVEEQFYLLWPLLLLPAGLAGRVRGARLGGWLVLTLTGAGLVSFAVSIGWTAADPPMAFLATPTRAWEFAAGGLVGALPTRPRGAAGGAGRAAASWVGIAVVLYSLLAISPADAFPGAVALVPVAGAALLVAADLQAAPRWSPARVMRVRPVQWLGDNSYSLYLWHWPLLIAAPWVTHRTPTAPGKVLILTATLLLAALTRRLVEDPVRTGTVWRTRRWLPYTFAAAGAAALLTLTSTLSADVGHTARQAQTAERAAATRRTRALLVSHTRSCYGAAAMDPANRCRRPYARPQHLDTTFAAADGRNDPCLQHYDAATPALCTLGATVAPAETIAIVGNSHAWRLIPALTLYGARHRWKILVATRIDCLGLTTTPTGTAGVSANCRRWSAAVQHRLLTLPHLDAVIFPSYRYATDFTAGRNATPAQLRTTRQQILTTWAALTAHRIRVIITGDVPGMRPTPDPDCLANSGARYDPCAVTRATVDRPNLTSTLAQQNPQHAAYLPLTRYFCDPTRCHALIGGVVVYFDSHHLTTTYARTLARYLGPDIAALLPKRQPPRR